MNWQVQYFVGNEEEGGYIYKNEFDTYAEFIEFIQYCISERFEIIEAAQC